eukprot:TRINITY_DN8984_c0_g1_i1.p1 TRINITY_DN8984_c0_g1~~TRINITY_DN8984_c0_g1_i1.p1  ORF type:complete len:126 (+),score=15.06 TRINITY_DN8984_c0_g1_i1:110-487(+)
MKALFTICIILSLFAFSNTQLTNKSGQNASSPRSSKTGITITIKNLHSTTLATFDVKPSDTIYSAKVRLEREQQIPVAVQAFLYAGRLLNDQKTFGDCKIRDGAVITVFLNTKGLKKLTLSLIHI